MDLVIASYAAAGLVVAIECSRVTVACADRPVLERAVWLLATPLLGVAWPLVVVCALLTGIGNERDIQ